ncbi:MAG: ribonuclease HII [Bacilli bacterium]|jgi:ribonuclease HII|nr:ribonuclease HII [Bacilli bacterium]
MSKLKEFDDWYRSDPTDLIAGFDEAGRGPLCGPVTAGGVVLPWDFDDPRINDSKKLTDKERRELFEVIKSKALYYHVSIISPQTIDQINILESSRLGMQQALDAMLAKGAKISYVLTDFVQLDSHGILQADLKHGDAQSISIAAASILAKVTRDDIMEELDKKYPQYDLKDHKGYPTKKHLELIEKYGIVKDIYRLTYAPVAKVLQKKS